MVLIHAVGAAAGMIKVTCPSCGEAQSKMRSKSGRYLCRRCHKAFASGKSGASSGSKARKSTLKRFGRQ